jgi:hypothetical protein
MRLSLTAASGVPDTPPQPQRPQGGAGDARRPRPPGGARGGRGSDRCAAPKSKLSGIRWRKKKWEENFCLLRRQSCCLLC